MPSRKSPAQLQRDIDEALARRHKQARDRWLSLQAGPHHRERQAAYDEMAALAQEVRTLKKRTHATKEKSSKTIANQLPDAAAKETKKNITVMKAFNSKVERMLDQAGARRGLELTHGPIAYREFLLETKAGLAHVTPLGNWVAVRFEDPEAAAKLVGTSGLNTYSGKWNHNYFAWSFNDAVSDVASWLKRIAS